MPAWGLTEEQINARPWGLSPDLLRPHKKITDPIHSDIYLTRLEVAVLDSRPLQRLRRVRQLGATQLVYPGASHMRFSHALGTLRTAQDLMDIALSQRMTPHPVPDLFAEWRSTLERPEYERLEGEAIVLARLGGLLHDIGHIPFGHTVEDDLQILVAHDKNEGRFQALWAELEEDLGARVDLYPGGIFLPDELRRGLKPLILSKAESETDSRYPFVADIVGNTICADLIDYLRRDHHNTGLPAGFGHRFLDGFYVTRSDHQYHSEHMVIRISRGGQTRADVVSELFKYLRYRYELSERALVHHAKLAADVMVGKAIEMWRTALAEEDGEEAATGLIETQMRRRGDDGLIEYLIDQSEARPDDKRWRGIGQLAHQLQWRRLFKPIGAYTTRSMADDLWQRYQSPSVREALEREVADFVGAEHGWMVAVWIPNPEMRFKPAEVLVDDGSGAEIVTLEKWDSENGHRGREIFQSHHDLWAMRVYCDARLSAEQRSVVLAYLASRLGISAWDGGDPDLTMPRIAAEHVVQTQGLPIASLEDAIREAERLAPSCTSYGDLVLTLTNRLMVGADSALEAWRRTRGSLEHPALRELVSEADESVVTLDDEDFEVGTAEGIGSLNLHLFIRELEEEVFGADAAAGRSQIQRARQTFLDDFQDEIGRRMPTSSPRRRSRGAPVDPVGTTRLAIELTIRHYLGNDTLL